MLGLYLLAAHLAGDFLLQTRAMAAQKLVDARVRAAHVSTYSLPFLLVLAAVRPGWRDAGLFLALLWTYHYAQDSRRFLSNVGDRISWIADGLRTRTLDGTRPPLEPNPWPPLPILIDQASHAAQLAVLGGVFLT